MASLRHLLDGFNLEFCGISLVTHGVFSIRPGGVYEARGDSVVTNPDSNYEYVMQPELVQALEEMG